MKILIMNNYYYPNLISGAEHSIKILAENLAVHGYKVFILSMDGDKYSDITEARQINGVYVYRSYSEEIYRRRILKNKGHALDKILNGFHSIYNIKMNHDLKIVIDIVKPDIIHTQNLVAMSYWVWKYAYKLNIPIIHTLRDYWLLDPTTNINQSPVFLTAPFRVYHRMLSNRYVSAVTSPSYKTLDIFKKNRYFIHSKKCVIVNVINYDTMLLKECLKEKMSRNTEIIRFLYVGNVAENKGIRLLADAFEQINANLKLTICGDGDLLEWVKKRKDSRIMCCGKIDTERLSEEYRKADVLIVPSQWEEPFGRTVIEGAQFGLPVIGSSNGGIPEIINTLNYGTVFRTNEELIQCIKKYSQREYLKDLYGVGPKNLNKYNIQNQIKMFDQLYKAVITEYKKSKG